MPKFHEKRTQLVFSDNNQRLRVPLLLMAGLLLIGGVWLWVSHSQDKEEPIQPIPMIAEESFKGRLAKTGAVPAPAVNTQANNAAKPEIPGLSQLSKSAPVKTNVLPTQTSKQVAVPMSKDLTIKSTPVVPPVQAVKKEQLQPVQSQISQAPPIEEGVTSRSEAIAEAKVGAGRLDPTSALTGLTYFPRSGKKTVSETAILNTKENTKDLLVPPPPPAPPGVALGGQNGNEGLSVGELPAPPPKPSIANKMKLVAVVGDRAILAFTDNMARVENHWPKTVTLGPGEKFESVSVVNVNDESVILDEDGERTVKTMDRVK